MRPFLASFLCFVAILAGSPRRAAHADGASWFVSEADLSIKLPGGYERLGRHLINFTRFGRSPEEDDLLRRAEAVYPTRIPFEPGSDAVINATNPVWWYPGRGLRAYPFVITTAMVQHYLEIAKTYSGDETASELIYTAYVVSATTDGDGKPVAGTGNVVVMRFSYYYWCGNLCAHSMRREKVVTFDSAGNVTGLYVPRQVSDSIS